MQKALTAHRNWIRIYMPAGDMYYHFPIPNQNSQVDALSFFASLSILCINHAEYLPRFMEHNSQNQLKIKERRVCV